AVSTSRPEAAAAASATSTPSASENQQVIDSGKTSETTTCPLSGSVPGCTFDAGTSATSTSRSPCAAKAATDAITMAAYSASSVCSRVYSSAPNNAAVTVYATRPVKVVVPVMASSSVVRMGMNTSWRSTQPA